MTTVLCEHPQASATRSVAFFSERHLSCCDRFRGRSYAEHGCELAIILREVVASPSLVRVALLHDLLKHPRGEALLPEAPVTAHEAGLIRGWHQHMLQKFVDWPSISRSRGSVHPQLHLLLAAHHLNDLRRLEHMPRILRTWACRKALRETAPEMRNVRLYAWAEELEERCFFHLHPREACKLQAACEGDREREIRCLAATAASIEKILAAHGISGHVESRRKSLYSLYRKMRATKLPLSDIHDRLGIRILADDTGSCYDILRCLHRHFSFHAPEAHDFIQSPKSNGYRSLHTLIITPKRDGGFPVEVQIRTPHMHWQNEYGPARHSFYKWMRYELGVPA